MLNSAHLRAPAAPDRRRREAALAEFAERMTRMIALLDAEGRRAARFPLYGALAKARYARQSAVLSALRERALSASRR
ncbi:MAG: hypothetical protein M0D55_12960 [Elusimicrobiota bacterium]|nr:MAG: hypothetical protein M0D55_12960 [Elusimicrobiota bacterium]